MSFKELPTVLYGSGYSVLESNYSKERIDEARDYICYALQKTLDDGTSICLGCSCGKDSTILLQLALEAVKKINFPMEKLYITHQRTTYETTSGTKYADDYIKTCEEHGVHIIVQTTPLHARYAVRTVGVGTGSHAGKLRTCTEQKSSIPRYNKWMRHLYNLSGTRAEESYKRANEPRETTDKNMTWSYIFRPLKFLTEADVWGYLKEIGTTDFGVTYDYVHDYYATSGQSRDGCWTCYAGRCKRDTLARMECRTRLQFLRCNGMHTITDLLHYKWQTLPPESVAGPKNCPNKFYEVWLASPKLACLSYRPIEFCMAAYEVVKDIERRRGEILIPEIEKIHIDDIHRFRYVYRTNRIKRWMMNPVEWDGLTLMDNFSDITKNEVGQYTICKNYKSRYKNLHWFKRLCLEYERRDMVYALPETKRYFTTFEINDDLNYLKEQLEEQIRKSGWVHDYNKEPFPGMFEAAEAMGVNCHPVLEETELYKRATDRDYRMSIEEEFYKRKQACYELVQESHDKFPELFKEPDGIFCGDNIVKFLDENNL